MESIHINYADHTDGYVRQVTDLDVESLLKDKTIDILLVGEGNFTFTVALAAIRESWKGIISTRYESETRYNPRPQFDEVQEMCVQFCHENGRLLQSDGTIHEYVRAVQMVESPPKEIWLFGIDATNIPENLTVKGKVVLFQCPWLPDEDSSQNGAPATQRLITDFLLHMSMKQNEGDYVLIGITTKFPYVKNYKLGDLLGKRLSRETDSSGRYNFLGADVTFIQEILKHGYNHTSCHKGTSIHEKIISDHLTLVFQRNGCDLSSSESNSSSEDSA